MLPGHKRRTNTKTEDKTHQTFPITLKTTIVYEAINITTLTHTQQSALLFTLKPTSFRISRRA